MLAATVIVATLAIVAVCLLRAPAWLQALAGFLVLALATQSILRQLRPPVVSVLWRDDGAAELRVRDRLSRDGREVLGMVSAARVTGPLIVLTVRWPPRQRAHLWLLPDNLDADTRRRLRMRLGAAGGGDLVSGNADSG